MKWLREGIDVDRARPHIFHRDYLILRVLCDEVRSFVARFGAELAGG